MKFFSQGMCQYIFKIHFFGQASGWVCREAGISVRQSKVRCFNMDLALGDLELVVFCGYKSPKLPLPYYYHPSRLGIVSVLSCWEESYSHMLNLRAKSLGTDGTCSYWMASCQILVGGRSFFDTNGNYVWLASLIQTVQQAPGLEMWWFVDDFLASTWPSEIVDKYDSSAGGEKGPWSWHPSWSGSLVTSLGPTDVCSEHRLLSSSFLDNCQDSQDLQLFFKI